MQMDQSQTRVQLNSVFVEILEIGPSCKMNTQQGTIICALKSVEVHQASSLFLSSTHHGHQPHRPHQLNALPALKTQQ